MREKRKLPRRLTVNYKSQHVQLNIIDLIYSRPYILYAKKLFIASQNCPEKILNLLLKNTCKFARGILQSKQYSVVPTLEPEINGSLTYLAKADAAFQIGGGGLSLV